MRGVLGLLSLLICALIVAYVWSAYTQDTATVAPALHDQAEQLTGRSAAGIPVSESIKTEDSNDNRGRFKGLLVTEVTPGGGMQTMYGLQKDDVIVNVESLTVNELNTGAAMRDFLVEAYQKSQPLVVIRHGVHVTLPQTPSATAPVPAPAAAPVQSIQSQLDAIRKQSEQ